MPRLDNHDPEVLKYAVEYVYDDELREEFEWAAREWETGRDLTGLVTPLDVCQDCAADIFSDHGIGADVEHPNYEDDDYHCCFCDVKLSDSDNLTPPDVSGRFCVRDDAERQEDDRMMGYGDPVRPANYRQDADGEWYYADEDDN